MELLSHRQGHSTEAGLEVGANNCEGGCARGMCAGSLAGRGIGSGSVAPSPLPPPPLGPFLKHSRVFVDSPHCAGALCAQRRWTEREARQRSDMHMHNADAGRVESPESLCQRGDPTGRGRTAAGPGARSARPMWPDRAAGQRRGPAHRAALALQRPKCDRGGTRSKEHQKGTHEANLMLECSNRGPHWLAGVMAPPL